MMMTICSCRNISAISGYMVYLCLDSLKEMEYDEAAFLIPISPRDCDRSHS